MIPIIPEKHLGAYLLGGLRWAATRPSAAALERAMPLYRRLAGQGFHHLPFFLIADLSLLLEEGQEVPFASDVRSGGVGMAGWSDAERGLRLRYENQILGRLLLEPTIMEVLELLRYQRAEYGLNAAEFTGRAQRLLELLLRHLAPHYPKTPRLNPAHLRVIALPEGDSESAHADFTEAMQAPAFFFERLQALVEGAANAVPWSRLLLAEDLFELVHHDVLSEESVRIGCRQILEVARRLGEIDPRGVNIADEGEAETAFLDESHYPTGGLSGLTNRGSMENLVLSELVYMDRTMAVDLFDLRFLEGELLFYLRDDGLLRRKRRTVHLILDASAEMAHKPMGYDAQLSILLQGLVLRITRDLLTVFSQDALQIEILYLYPNAEAETWRRELSLMGLLLDDITGQGLASLRAVRRKHPAMVLEALQNPTRKTYALIVTTHNRIEQWQGVRERWLTAQPPVYPCLVSVEPPGTREERWVLPADGADWATLSVLKTRIIDDLVGMRRSL